MPGPQAAEHVQCLSLRVLNVLLRGPPPAAPPGYQAQLVKGSFLTTLATNCQEPVQSPQVEGSDPQDCPPL